MTKSDSPINIFMANKKNVRGVKFDEFAREFKKSENLNVSDFNNILNFINEQAGYWLAEYEFSPILAPNQIAEQEYKKWVIVQESTANALIEKMPELKEKLPSAINLTYVKSAMGKRMKYNQTRPFERRKAEILSKLSFFLNRIGFSGLADTFYTNALYPKATVGRYSKKENSEKADVDDKVQLSLTKEQVLLMKGLVGKEISELNDKRQNLIDGAAKEGKTIPTGNILKYLDETSLPPEEILKIKQDFYKKYGDQIPIDEAYKLLKELEKEE